RILSDILEVSSNALFNHKKHNASGYDRLILEMLQFNTLNFEAETFYSLLLKASSFVASLSDGAAVHLHNKITGKQLQ
ncbi:MAG: hypothetical protein RLZZ241_50, partial [Bacteroidota bacterium]